MSRTAKILIALSVVVVSLLAAVFLLFTNLYSGRFGMGVWVNDVYATGLTAFEVARLLEEESPDEEIPENIILSSREGKILSIPSAALNFSKSYRKSVKELLDSQNPLLWFRGIKNEIRYTVEPEESFDADVLEEAIAEWEIFDMEDIETTRIEKTPSGYELVMETVSVPLKDAMVDRAAAEITDGEYIISLDRDECYDSDADAENTASVLKTWEAIQDTRGTGIVYLMGDEHITIDSSVTDKWLLTWEEFQRLSRADDSQHAGRAAKDKKDEDESDVAEELYLIDGEAVELPEDLTEINGFAADDHGDLVIKGSEIVAFVDGLCDKYDTLDKDRDFKTADGRTVKVPAGTYGNKIDRDAEVEWLTDAVASKKSGDHVPALVHEAKQLGVDDIGGTYIEVDIGKQTLYYFVNGRIDMEVPVVTGCAARHNNTPPGVYDIYFMQRNRTLRGEGYASFVNYWMAFYNHYGLHDATWRGSFGGEIYKNSGSHGCVNLPKTQAGELYEKVEVGMPVIVHE